MRFPSLSDISEEVIKSHCLITDTSWEHSPLGWGPKLQKPGGQDVTAIQLKTEDVFFHAFSIAC